VKWLPDIRNMNQTTILISTLLSVIILLTVFYGAYNMGHTSGIARGALVSAMIMAGHTEDFNATHYAIFIPKD